MARIMRWSVPLATLAVWISGCNSAPTPSPAPVKVVQSPQTASVEPDNTPAAAQETAVQKDRPDTKSLPPEPSDHASAPATIQPADEAPSSSELTKRPELESTPRSNESRTTVQTDAALDRYHQLLRRKPFHRVAFEELVQHYVSRDEINDLVRHYEETSAALPDDVSLRIVLARLYARTNQAEKAVEVLDHLAADSTTESDSTDLLVFQAQVYQQADQRDRAQVILQKAAKQSPTIAKKIEITESLADLHLRAGELDQATQVLTDLAGEYPDQFFHGKRVADSLAKRNLHAAAVQQYRPLLKLVERETDKRCEVLRQLGRSLEAIGQRDEAIKVYVEAIDLLANGHWLQRELNDRVLQLYRAAGRTDELIAYCRQRIERSPEQTTSRGLLADVLVSTGRADDARQVLVDATRLFPVDRSLSNKRIEVLERLKDFEGVSDEYQRIIGQLPDEIDLYVDYGQFLARTNQLDQARNQWRYVLQQVTEASLALRLGGLFEQFDMPNDAVACYEQAIRLDARRPESYTSLARLHLSHDGRDAALKILQEMAGQAPDDAALQAHAAQGLLACSFTNEALTSLEKACELAPKEPRYHTLRADLLIQMGKVDAAIEARRTVIDLLPAGTQAVKSIDVLVSIASSHGKLAELKAAETARLEQLADSNRPLVLLLLARIAETERNLAEARRMLDTLLASDPSHEEGCRQLALWHAEMGDVDAAIQQYRKLIGIYPVRSRFYYEAIVELCLRFTDRGRAAEFLQELASTSPGNAAVLRWVADELSRLDFVEEAVEYYRQCVALQGDNHAVRLQYARVLRKTGRLDESLQQTKIAAFQDSDRSTAADAMALVHDVAGELGALDELLAELASRLEVNPDDVLAARGLADLYIREYEYARASDLLKRLLEQRPSEVDLHLVRAELNRRLLRFPEALDEYHFVMRFPAIDRDFVLGETGKTHYEAGQLEEARRTWKRINNKLYAGTLLSNNEFPEDSIEAFQEGIRLTPDAFPLHRHLIETLERVGRSDDAISAAQRLLDLEPDNALNIQNLAEAYLRRGDRAKAAEIATRLFGARVRRAPTQSTGGNAWMSAWMQSQASYYTSRSGNQAGPLSDAIAFFVTQGLTGELEESLSRQLEVQPDNGVLKLAAATAFQSSLVRPERARSIYIQLETASLPDEYHDWTGHSSQRDYFRCLRLTQINQAAGYRDEQVATLSAKPASELSNDELVILGVARSSQGAIAQAVEALQAAIERDPKDLVALKALVDAYLRDDRYADAEPFAKNLVELTLAEFDQRRKETIERVQRDLVRQQPPRKQLQITPELIEQIVEQWLYSASEVNWYEEPTIVTATLYQARLQLATIAAKLNRLDEARQIWKSLEPATLGNREGWVTLATVAQTFGDNDLAFSYYERAMQASQYQVSHPLLRQLTGDFAWRQWYSDRSSIDTQFNRQVEVFASRNKIVDLFGYLRRTGAVTNAKHLAERLGLLPQLLELQKQRVNEAQARYRDSTEDAWLKSVPYFGEVAQLAEFHDWQGDWNAARAVYEQYLNDFPDELGLLQTLSEIAEVQGNYLEAITWERQILDTTRRLARRGAAWQERELYIVPSQPRLLATNDRDESNWRIRWNRQYAGYWGMATPTNDSTESWIRVASLYHALDNTVAAVDALQQAANESNATALATQILQIGNDWQMKKELLPVFRTLHVADPSNVKVQLALAESLVLNDRRDGAIELYDRIRRRGAPDLGTLTEVQRKIEELQPDQASGETSLAELEADAQANPANAGKLLRLGKAYYYSLRFDEALEVLLRAQGIAPHLDGLNDLIIHIHTLRDDDEQILSMLRKKIDRTKDPNERSEAHSRLVNELLRLCRFDEALSELTKPFDSGRQRSHQDVESMLLYFERYDDAIEQCELARRSQANDENLDLPEIVVLAYRGDIEGAAQRMIDATATSIRQENPHQTHYYGNSQQQNAFQWFNAIFVAYPEVERSVKRRLIEARQKNPTDAVTSKMLLDFYWNLRREDLAQVHSAKSQGPAIGSQDDLQRMIDDAANRHDYSKAIELGERWLAQGPKAQPTPNSYDPYQADRLATPRNAMICNIGDWHWRLGDKEKARATYRRIVDEDVEESRIAFAAICLVRDQQDEAKAIVDDLLSRQQLKSPTLLRFRAFIAALEGNSELVYDLLSQCLPESAALANADPFRSDGGTLNELAYVARLAGRTKEFTQVLENQIQQAPNAWSGYVVLRDWLRQIGEFEKAETVLERAAHVSALREEFLQNRILALEKSGETDALIPLYEQLIEAIGKRVSSPTVSRGYQRRRVISNYLGGNYGDQGSSEGRIERDRLGHLLWLRGDHDAALQWWHSRREPDSSDDQISLATLYEIVGESDLAEKTYQKALVLNPEDTVPHGILARMATYRGDLAAAAHHVKETFGRSERYIRKTEYLAYGDYRGMGRNTSLMQLSNVDLATHIAKNLFEDTERSEQTLDNKTRYAIAMLAGDWNRAQSALDRMLQAGFIEPGFWNDRFDFAVMAGDWDESLRARKWMDRLAKTDLRSHRDQLRLVLAGKHIKSAAAGMAVASSTGTASASGQNPTSYYYGDRYQEDSNGDALAAIYERLHQFDQAEASLLRGSANSAEATMAQLARLMQHQGRNERVAQLARLGVVIGNHGNELDRYLEPLVDSGHVELAMELLLRSKRTPISSGNHSAIYSGGYPGGSSNNRESTWLDKIVQILERTGQTDNALKRVDEWSAEDPAEIEVARLAASLHLKTGSPARAREVLSAAIASRPDNQELQFALFRLLTELKEWPGALAMMDDFERRLPARINEWRLWRTLIDLVSGHRQRAMDTLNQIHGIDAEHRSPYFILPQILEGELCSLFFSPGGDQKIKQDIFDAVTVIFTFVCCLHLSNQAIVVLCRE